MLDIKEALLSYLDDLTSDRTSCYIEQKLIEQFKSAIKVIEIDLNEDTKKAYTMNV